MCLNNRKEKVILMKKGEKIWIGVITGITVLLTVLLLVEKVGIWQKPESQKNIVQKDEALKTVEQKEAVIIQPNRIYNKERLEQFIKNTEMNAKNRVEDTVKIIQYTTEGDPITTELSYKILSPANGETKPKTTYVLTIDTIQDKWSVEADRKVTVKDNLPGDIYGIVERTEGNTVLVELALYAEIEYADESVIPYENLHICSYPSNSQQETGVSFYGKVVESTANHILVEPNEGEEIRKSASRVSIGLGEKNDALYMVGTNVKITYTGDIRETEPAQIDVLNIEIKSVEDFKLRFSDKGPQTSEKIHKILDASETDKQDYSVYTYQGSVNIILNGKEMTLRDALLEDKITLNEIIAKANQDLSSGKIKGDMYRDGGSTVYQYGSYTILKCHTLDGNRDVYIGTPEMNINDVLK